MSVLLQVWNHPVYTVGRKHLMTDALSYCGARNVFDGFERHRARLWMSKR